MYTLEYPNLEVRGQPQRQRCCTATGCTAPPASRSTRPTVASCCRRGDLAGCATLFHAFFASIPNDWYRNSPIARFEGYWASVFYSHFAALGLDIRVEDVDQPGPHRHGGAVRRRRCSCSSSRWSSCVPQGRALQQIKDRGYADKYRGRGEPIHLIGVEFSRAERNIVGFEVETLAG